MLQPVAGAGAGTWYDDDGAVWQADSSTDTTTQPLRIPPQTLLHLPTLAATAGQ
jgi:hypothetical protein